MAEGLRETELYAAWMIACMKMAHWEATCLRVADRPSPNADNQSTSSFA